MEIAMLKLNVNALQKYQPIDKNITEVALLSEKALL